MADPAGPVVAIDGPAGAGKSAVGRRVAEKLELPFLDSGLLYRAVTWLAHERGVGPTDVEGLVRIAATPELGVEGGRVRLGGRDLTAFVHRPEILDSVSGISAIAAVREAINAKQRSLAGGGMVVAGRDIGTVVFPDTPFKFFLTASVEERVRRRSAQLEKRGESVDAGAMAREITRRDELDSIRAVAPLRPASDAVVIDTDGLDRDQVVTRIVARVRASAAR